MATNSEHIELLKRFFQAVEAFNSRNWAELEKLFDEHIVTGHIVRQDHAHTVRGKAKVKAYLEELVKKRNDVPRLTVTGPVTLNVRTGVVSGTALWDRYENDSIVSYPVSYSYTWKLVPDQNEWLLLNMHASPA